MTTYATRREATGIPWWLVLLEGIASLIIGLFLLTSPGITLLVLIQVMGVFWLVGGIFRIISIFLDSSLWGWKLLAGILGVIAGLIILQHPLWSTVLVPTIIVTIIGIEGLLFGGISLVLAFRGGGWGIGLLGVLSIVFGAVLLGNPLIGAAVLPIVLGISGLVGGIASIVMAFRLR